GRVQAQGFERAGPSPAGGWRHGDGVPVRRDAHEAHLRLREVATEGFRNLVDARVEVAAGTTVLLGDNGQGKTNFLEAIGVLATTRSFRRARAPELAAHGKRSWRVAGRIEAAGAPVELEAAHEDGRRVTRVTGTPAELA